MTKFCNDLNRKSFELVNIWFQQYNHNETHGWHTHSENYTGVYYLEMPTGPQTQIFDGEIRNLPVQEGDLVIFPSFLIHRAPPVLNNNRKTMISIETRFYRF